MAIEGGAPRLLAAGELDAIQWRVDAALGGPKICRRLLGLVRLDVPALLGHISVLTDQLAHAGDLANYHAAHIVAQEARIAALEVVAGAAREIPVTRYLSNPHEITRRLDAVEAALTTLDELIGRGTDGD